MKDLVGQRFGKLVVSAFHRRVSYESGAIHFQWNCVCDCGGTAVVFGNNLSRGKQMTCGCGRGLGRLTHGFSRSKDKQKRSTFKIWAGMVERCRSGHRNYGGRGIRVCDRWLRFENFVADMGLRPDGLTLERKDVNGDYGPENCKWADRIEQANNTRKTRYVEYEGKSQPLAIVHRQARIAITLPALWIRIRNGWSVSRALTQPVEPRRARRVL